MCKRMGRPNNKNSKNGKGDSVVETVSTHCARERATKAVLHQQHCRIFHTYVHFPCHSCRQQSSQTPDSHVFSNLDLGYLRRERSK